MSTGSRSQSSMPWPTKLDGSLCFQPISPNTQYCYLYKSKSNKRNMKDMQVVIPTSSIHTQILFPFPKYSELGLIVPHSLFKPAMSHHHPLIISLSLFTAFHLLPALPDPDPLSPPSTIPAFPEQSDVSACPLDLSDDLFRGIKSACASKPHHDPDYLSSDLRRTRCCPVLAAWLYSAYSKTGLRAAAAKSPTQTASYDMPVLPDDSETCVDTLEKALGNRGIQLPRPNETCDVVYCYCGVRLHTYSCPEAFSVNSGGELVGGDAVKKLERDCSNGGCSKCLNSLHLLNGDKSGRSNKSERASKMHNQDCELMGLSWLLNKDRVAYIHTVSAVLRSLMMSTNNPAACSLNTDGLPLAVDSSEINSQSSFSILAHQYLVPVLSLLCASTVLLLTRY